MRVTSSAIVARMTDSTSDAVSKKRERRSSAGRRSWLQHTARSRRILSIALLILGVGLLVFSIGSYGWMAYRQHELTSQWQSQPVLPVAATQPAPNPNGSGVTLLSIPKIGLQAGILDGTDRKSLLLAPGHLQNTAWPGDSGNAVVAGHRDTFFRHLHELVTGDDIYVLRNGGRYHYVVTQKATVDPSDVRVIRPTSDNRLTLITCYPTYYIGPAPKRLVVVAQLQMDSPAVAQRSSK